MQESNQQFSPPKERLLKKIWTILPVLFLFGAIALVIALGFVISGKMALMAEERAKGLATRGARRKAIFYHLTHPLFSE
jgi:hypothetical protein